MVKDLSKMCLTGPAVVESVLGIKTTLDELGGSEVHGKKSGVAHVVCEDEKTCLDEIRMLLTYLPQNCSKEARQSWMPCISSRRQTAGWPECFIARSRHAHRCGLKSLSRIIPGALTMCTQ